MQHVLMRVWTLTTEAAGATEAVPAAEDASACPTPGQILLSASTYEAVGGLANALSQHADEAYQELAPEDRRVAEVLFRCLSERGDGAATRGGRLGCDRSPRSPEFPRSRSGASWRRSAILAGVS